MSPFKRLTTVMIFAMAWLAASATIAAERGDPIAIAHRYQIDSKILGETRPYLVHTPPKYDYRDRAYPVLILLDGDTNLAHTSASVDFLAENGRVPEMLVVGVPNIDRSRDLTPPPSKPETGTSSAAADKFLAFIADELIPEIERRYRTRPYRVLVGHSLGGLFAVYALNERPEVFNAYLPISPALWYDNQAIVNKTAELIAAKPDLHADIYITIGNEGGGMLSSFHALSAALSISRSRNLRWQAKRSADETHGSIPFRSTYDGLQALFDGWYIADPVAYYEQAGLAGIEKHYAQLSAKMGFGVPVPLRPFITLHHALEGQNRMGEAIRVVERAMDLYPHDAPGHFELARLYVAVKDEQRARQSLQRALKLYPGMQHARGLLRTLNAPEPTDATVPVARQLRLVGDYTSLDDTLTISMREGTLRVQHSNGAVGCELRPLSESHFYCLNKDVEYTFEHAGGGKVSSLYEHHPDYRITRQRAD